ncbi:MAG: MFS transporter [Candidatus Hodarchaeota archaeon]
MEEIANRETFINYMYFWVGQLFSLLGSLVLSFAIFVWITDVTGSALMLSIANFIFLVPMIIVTPFAGVIADRINRKIMILVVDSLQAYLSVILALLFIVGFTELWVVFLFLGLRSVCQQVHGPVVMTIMPLMVPKDKLSRVNGIRYFFLGIVQFAGPAVGATLLFFFPIKYVLWIDVITYFIALIPLIALKLPAIKIDIKPVEKKGFVKEFKEGLTVIKGIPGLLTIMLIAMMLYMLSQPALVLAPFFIKVTHGGNNFTLAIVEMVLQGGMILGALVPFFKKKWNNQIRVLFTGMVIINFGYLLYGLAPIGYYSIIGTGAFIMGFVIPIVDIIVITVVQSTVPSDKMGRVSSILNIFIMVANPIGAILSGPLSELWGVSFLYMICAIVSLIITIIPYLFTGIRHVDYNKEIIK